MTPAHTVFHRRELLILGNLNLTGSKHMCSVAQLSLTFCNPMDYSPRGSSVHGIFQARILELLAISYSRGSS